MNRLNLPQSSNNLFPELMISTADFLSDKIAYHAPMDKIFERRFVQKKGDAFEAMLDWLENPPISKKSKWERWLHSQFEMRGHLPGFGTRNEAVIFDTSENPNSLLDTPFQYCCFGQFVLIRTPSGARPYVYERFGRLDTDGCASVTGNVYGVEGRWIFTNGAWMPCNPPPLDQICNLLVTPFGLSGDEIFSASSRIKKNPPPAFAKALGIIRDV